MASKRFLMVPEDSSAARMPRPGATMALATLFSSARFIGASVSAAGNTPRLEALLAKPVATRLLRRGAAVGEARIEFPAGVAPRHGGQSERLDLGRLAGG